MNKEACENIKKIYKKTIILTFY